MEKKKTNKINTLKQVTQNYSTLESELHEAFANKQFDKLERIKSLISVQNKDSILHIVRHYAGSRDSNIVFIAKSIERKLFGLAK